MVDAAYQAVVCSGCGAQYVCTPSSDYYHRPDVEPEERTLENGVCESCLLTKPDGSKIPMVDPRSN